MFLQKHPLSANQKSNHIALSSTQIGAQTLKTQIVSLEFFAGLYQDMASVTISPGEKHTVIGLHPELGRISFIQVDAMTGDGLLLHLDPAALYVRRPGELTARERDALEDRAAA